MQLIDLLDSWVPNRKDLLFIDNVDFVSDTTIVCDYLLTSEFKLLNDANLSFWPGVLQLEAMTQVAATHMMYCLAGSDDLSHPVLTGIRNSKFKRPVPYDTSLTITANLQKRRTFKSSTFYSYSCEVNGFEDLLYSNSNLTLTLPKNT